MSKLIKINSDTDKSFLNMLFDNDIIVYEDVQGSKIWVNFNTYIFTIKQKSLSNDPINLADIAMQKFYSYAIEFFNTLEKRILLLLNKNWWFCFEYFPDEQPANIRYDFLPKNHLVLTAINKNGKYQYNVAELNEYARLFDVDVLPVIFNGRLDNDRITTIKNYLRTSPKDLEFIFDEQSFAFFFYKLLDPKKTSSFLMKDTFQKNIEKLIIQIDGSKYTFELLNPMYSRINDTMMDTDYTNEYTRILLDFLNFCQTIDMNNIKLKGVSEGEVYLNLICDLFNIYVDDMKNTLLEYDFNVPTFFNKDKFRVNKDVISNKKTIGYISEHTKIEYIFKLLLCSFSKEKKKIIGVFTDDTLQFFNNFVKEIDDRIEMFLYKTKELNKNKKDLITFDDFNILDYDTDVNGNIYPKIYNDIKAYQPEKKKKMKK